MLAKQSYWVLSWRKVNFASNGIHCIVFTLDPLLTECDQYLNLLKQLCRKFKFQLSGVYHNASRWEGCQSPALNLFSIPQIYPRKFVGPRLTVYICFKDNMSHLQMDIPTLMDSYKHFLPIIQCYGWSWNQTHLKLSSVCRNSMYFMIFRDFNYIHEYANCLFK